MYLEVLSLKYREMSKNYIFRELECQVTKEEIAELCFKSVRTVTGWDEGNPIPPECKRLMRMAKVRELLVKIGYSSKCYTTEWSYRQAK